MSHNFLSLAVFCAVVWIDVTALMADLLLHVTGQATITQHARGNAWLALAIVAFNCLAPVTLAWHLWGSKHG